MQAQGVYDVDGWRMEGRADIHAMVRSAAHQNLVAKGCCHFLGPCVVTVSGDEAVAVCESLVLIRDGDGYRVWRATAHHFALRRIDDRWQITTRQWLEAKAEYRALYDAEVTNVSALRKAAQKLHDLGQLRKVLAGTQQS